MPSLTNAPAPPRTHASHNLTEEGLAPYQTLLASWLPQPDVERLVVEYVGGFGPRGEGFIVQGKASERWGLDLIQTPVRAVRSSEEQ